MERIEFEKQLYKHFPESYATSFEFVDNALPFPLLIIKAFSCNTDKKRYSFAFDLEPFLNSGKIARKTWITIEPNLINIRYWEPYKAFNHCEEKFTPYSAALDKYAAHAENLKIACSNIYLYNIKHE
jgi:hypothetical protein